MQRFVVLAAAILAISLATSWTPAAAQFGKLKDKVKDASKQAEKILEKPAGEAAAPESTAAADAPATSGGGTAAGEMALYTKYDFVPGDKVIFYDDLSREEMGEFPSRWGLNQGVFEVAAQGGRNWILCTDRGTIFPKIPAGPLPPKYTFELEFWSKGPGFPGHWFHIQWVGAENEEIGDFGIQDMQNSNLRILNKDLASKTIPPLAAGLHTMRIMATATSIKCYIDHERVANVPAIEGFQPVGLRVLMDPWMDPPGNPMLIGTLRYAEGGKTLRQQLDEAGRIVTHGILFDSGSAQIKPESFKTLADIGQLLGGDAVLRLSIEGHTDSDGAADANLKLSQDRAGAVKAYLVDTYKVDAGRLQTQGFGATKPIDANETAEGKANNRRVELVKL